MGHITATLYYKSFMDAKLQAYQDAYTAGNKGLVIEYYNKSTSYKTILCDTSESLYTFAARFDDLDAMELLHKLGDRSYNVIGHYGTTPTNVAIFYGHLDCIKFLLDLNRDSVNLASLINDAVCYAINLTLFDPPITGIELLLQYVFDKGIQLDKTNLTGAVKLAKPRYHEIKKLFVALYDLESDCQLTEDEVSEIRYKICFSRSLVSKLLL
jgi:ankyrin repeat protein